MLTTLNVSLVLLALPVLASAAQLSASASCEANNGINVLNCTPVSPANYVPPNTVTNAVMVGIGEATYSVRANYGNVGIYLNAETRASSGPVTTFATASANASFSDEVLISSNTLALGTPIVATTTFAIDGRARGQATSIPGEVTASSYAWLRANYNISQQGPVGPLLQFSGCSATSAQFAAGCSDVYASETVTYSFAFNTFIGAVLLVSGDLGGQVNATVGANAAAGAFPMNFGTVSSLNSSHTYFTAPNASFVGGTGHNYAAPVPEPTSGAMLLAGVTVLLVASKRRTRRRFATVAYSH
jgi:hypothetical protein